MLCSQPEHQNTLSKFWKHENMIFIRILTTSCHPNRVMKQSHKLVYRNTLVSFWTSLSGVVHWRFHAPVNKIAKLPSSSEHCFFLMMNIFYENTVLSCSINNKLLDQFDTGVCRRSPTCCPFWAEQYTNCRLLKTWLTHELSSFMKLKFC